MAKFASIVFHQDAEADEAMSLLEEDGAETAIGYLSAWDMGDETTDAAEVNGRVYEEIPMTSDVTDTHEEGDYILSWSLPLNWVHLYRKV